MKLHIGVDETSGVIHSLTTTAANTHDSTQTVHLLHGQEATCWGDAGYLGVQKRKELADTPIDWRIASRVGTRRQMDEVALRRERIKASVRANVEHAFCRTKQQCGYRKVRYRGLENNTNRLQVLAAFSNLLTCRRMVPV